MCIVHFRRLLCSTVWGTGTDEAWRTKRIGHIVLQHFYRSFNFINKIYCVARFMMNWIHKTVHEILKSVHKYSCTQSIQLKIETETSVSPIAWVAENLHQLTMTSSIMLSLVSSLIGNVHSIRKSVFHWSVRWIVPIKSIFFCSSDWSINGLWNRTQKYVRFISKCTYLIERTKLEKLFAFPLNFFAFNNLAKERNVGNEGIFSQNDNIETFKNETNVLEKFLEKYVLIYCLVYLIGQKRWKQQKNNSSFDWKFNKKNFLLFIISI